MDRADMTHPLTPREKVAALKTNDPTNPAHRLASDLQAGHFAAGESRDDLIEVLSNLPRYAALASGSGDHAELARLKAAMSKSNDEICQSLGKALGYPWFKDDQRNFPGATEENGVCVGEHVAESIADEAASRISALLEKNAALRAECDGMVEEVSRSQARLHAATEAERKLAEAVGLLRDLASWFDGSAYNGAWVIRSGDLGVDDAICAARTFLSKEAERG